VDDPILVPKENKGSYLVAFDPLDGSSNIDCNAPVGTIFSIYENKKEEVLLKGDRIIAAGYVLYGPATELIIAVNGKVDRFVLNSQSKYIFIETITLKGKSKKIYSINEANSNQWKKDIDQYIAQYKEASYTARYIGSMVGDVHRTLMYGGMFCYPADQKNPNGKLRLFYECYPIAYIMELAGGKAIVGNKSNQRILEVEPSKVHQRTPILLGTIEEIAKYETILLSKL
jgi:fructose-1,6-bisphosphatase I